MWYLGTFRLEFEKTIVLFEIFEIFEVLEVFEILEVSKILEVKVKVKVKVKVFKILEVFEISTLENCFIWIFLCWNLKKPLSYSKWTPSNFSISKILCENKNPYV